MGARSTAPARSKVGHPRRGEVYLRQGKILEAARDFKRAVDLDPENRDPLTRRARLLAAAALQTLEAASPSVSAAPRAASCVKASPKPPTSQKPKPMSGKPGASKMQAQPRGAGAVVHLGRVAQELELQAGIVAEPRERIAGLRAGHGIIARRPIVRTLLGIVIGKRIGLRIVDFGHDRLGFVLKMF